MFAQQESQRLWERGRERENERGRERERGRGREGEEESFSVSSARLLKCQLLSSWLAQFHSSRGRRRTRSSHDPFLNTRNYCRESPVIVARSSWCKFFFIAANHPELHLLVRGAPPTCDSLWKQRSACLCKPKQTAVVCGSSTDIDAWMVISTPFLVPALLDAGPLASSDYCIWFSKHCAVIIERTTTVVTIQSEIPEFCCWTPKLVRLFVYSRWPVGCQWVSCFTSLSAVAMATAHHWAASEASSVAAEALEVTLSFPIGVWVVAVLLSLPAWTFRATCPSVTAFVIPKCDCPISWITTRWPKSFNKRPHGSHFSTSAAMPTPSSSFALSLGKHPF